MINIALVDDQQLFRESLVDAVQSDDTISCVMQCANGKEFLSILECASEMPHVVLLDLEMPVMDGIVLNDVLQRKYPDLKVIVLSIHANDRLVASLIKTGVSGYLSKNCDKKELLKAIKMVHEQGFYINADTMRAIQQHSHDKVGIVYNVNNIPINLSKREVEILTLICKEYSNADIAAELFISQRTVEGHRNNIIQKIGCKNIAGMVLFALRYSIFTPPFSYI